MMYYPNVELISPDSTGIIRTKLNKEQLKPIWDNVKEIEKDFDAHSNQSANDDLVGHIQKEFWLKEETSRYLDSFILPLIQKHTETYDYVHKQPTFRKEFGGMALDNTQLPVIGSQFWVNFMAKHEFNPVHFHDGLFSFVLWLKAPYDLIDEHNHPIVRNATGIKKPGAFYYIRSDMATGIDSDIIQVDRSNEGGLILFPSKLNHGVYPFYTSDEYRISISGNYSFDLSSI